MMAVSFFHIKLTTSKWQNTNIKFAELLYLPAIRVTIVRIKISFIRKVNYTMDIKNTLFSLSDSFGVSGEEFNAGNKAMGFLKEICPEAVAEIDDFGSVVAFIGERDENKETILLDAHIDQIGLIVTYIDDKGFIKVANCGGVDRRLLLAQTVTVWGKTPIKGVVSTLPPHVQVGEKSSPKIEDIVIDTGFTKEKLEEIVSLGDKITLDSEKAQLLNDRVTAKAIDDRSGIVAILRAIELLLNKGTKYNIAVCFSSQEELGERGAKIAAYNINPDLAIAVDVSFATTPDSQKHKCGEMGKGVMIGISPTLNKKMSMDMISLAKKNNIPCQLEVMEGETGTNADRIGETRKGVRAVTLSIPIRYMHTPVETIEISDIENTAQLIAAYIRK